MFFVSIRKYSVTFSGWKSSEKELQQNTSQDIEKAVTLTS